MTAVGGTGERRTRLADFTVVNAPVYRLDPGAKLTWQVVVVGLSLTIVLGWLVQKQPGLGLPLALLPLGVMGAMWLAPRPRVAFSVFLASIAAVPVWAAANAIVVVTPSVLAFLLVTPAILRTGGRLRLTDWWLVGFLSVCMVATVLFDSPRYAFTSLVLYAATAYIVGRRLGPAAGEQWVYKAMALTTAAVGAWACLEFAFGWHVFEGFIGRPEESFWRDIQVRGGVARSEAAFGHSIALGGFVAMGIPFAIGGPFSTSKKVALVALMAAGVIASLSRGPMLGAVLAFILASLFLPSSRLSTRARTVLVLVGVFVMFAVTPYVLRFFTLIGPEETEVSAEYRQDLISHWSDDLNLFGQADHVRINSAGLTVYRDFASIDNAWLQLGLQFGWVALGVAALAVAACTWRVLRLRGGPAEIAVASQALIWGTVALITQYGPAVWLLAGLAVSFALSGNNQTAGNEETSAALTVAAGESFALAASSPRRML